MKILPLILGSILLSTLALGSHISVISPSRLATQFDDNDNEIDFALSHYGNIPYGSHFVGTIIVPHPIDACSPIAHFADDEFMNIEHPIAIVKKGECRAAIKSRNVQFAGAKVMIMIGDTDYEKGEFPDWFGHEHGADDIKIPNLLVGKSDGEKLLKFAQSNNGTDVILSITFTQTKSNIANLDYWYSAADTFKSSFVFLRQFYEYWKRNNRVITFVPHVVTWTCADCKEKRFKTTENADCLSGGRYCAPDPDDEGPLTGADVVREDLRQMCTFKKSQELWWDYAIAVGEQCFSEGQDLQGCGNRMLLEKATTEQYNFISDCISSSYITGDQNRPHNDKLDDNKMLKENKDLQIEYAINQFPVLFINQKPYYGKLHRSHLVFEEVCRNMDPWPEDCNVALSRTGEATYTTTQSHTGRIVLLVIVMLIVSIFFIFYCRRMMKKENKDMSLEVGGMVNRYFSVNDSG